MSATPLTSLPVELVNKIVSYVPVKSDIGALRLTSQVLNEICTPFYFETIPLYAEWEEEDKPDPPFPNQIDYNVRCFMNILDNEKLKKLVKKVEIYTCNPDCDHHPHWAHHGGNNMYRGWMPTPDLSRQWLQAYQRLPELPKIESVSLIFDRHAGEIGNGAWPDEGVLTSCYRRVRETEDLMRLLGGRIRDMSIRNMQLNVWEEDDRATDGEDIQSVALRTKVLSGLRALRMNVVHEQVAGEGDSVYNVTNCLGQWVDFPSAWLSPAMSLRHLTIYSDLPVGWYPKVDLRPIYLPRLETLALGQFVFSHDHQFEFITKHASTLQELFLDHCSILYQHGASQCRHEWLDDEGYQRTEPQGPGYSTVPEPGEEKILTLCSYATRWCDVFDEFSRSLPRLRTFRFGISSHWNFDTDNRRDDGEPGRPVMPWEAEHEIECNIFPERYQVWDDWDEHYFQNWQESDSEAMDPEVWGEELFKQFEDYPQCEDEDERALSELLMKLGRSALV